MQKKMNRLSSKLKDDRNKHANGYGTEQEHQRLSSPCSDEKAGTANLRVSGAAGIVYIGYYGYVYRKIWYFAWPMVVIKVMHEGGK